MAKPNPFDTVKKLFTDNKVKIDNHFFVNILLSHIPESLLWSIEINKYLGLPSWALDSFFVAGIRKRKNPPYKIPYIKKTTQKQTLLQEKISNTFCTNNKHSQQIIDLLRKQLLLPESFFGLKKGM